MSWAMDSFNEIVSGSFSGDVYGVLYETPQNFADGVPWTVVKNFYNDVILPLALGIIVIYFLIALIEKLSSEHFNWDQMVKTFAVFVGSWYLIQNAFPIMEGLFNIGADLLDSLEDVFVAAGGDTEFTGPVIGEATKEALWKNLTGKNSLEEDVKFLDSVKIWAELKPYQLCLWILGLCTKIVCYSRIIEILIRTMFAPIALSDCFHRGLDSGGARFLKNYFAVALQGAVIYAVMAIYSIVSVSVLGNLTDAGNLQFFAYVGTSIVISFATVGLLFKSLSFTKELVGTG